MNRSDSDAAVDGDPGERVASLGRRLLLAQEDERRAMATALHGEVGQMLTALKLTLSGPGVGDEGLAEARELVSGLLERVRDLEVQLRPPMLDDLGLKDTLEWYLERVARREGLTLEQDLRGLSPRPDPELETACFRVIQEAVDNVARHARARRLGVRVEMQAGSLSLEVTDDGGGFDVDAARERARSGRTAGLAVMSGRLALMGGELRIESRPGHGTHISGVIPAGGAGMWKGGKGEG